MLQHLQRKEDDGLVVTKLSVAKLPLVQPDTEEEEEDMLHVDSNGASQRCWGFPDS